MIHPEDELDGFLGEQRTISATTHVVGNLLQKRSVAERWCQRCRESFEESCSRKTRHQAWENEFQSRDVLTRPGHESELKKNVATVEPHVGGPLPFSPHQSLTIADCYFVLAIVHNSERLSGRLEVFASGDERALRFYYAQLACISNISACDQLALADCLARVQDDLQEALKGLAPRSGKAKRSTSKGEARAKIVAAFTQHHKYATSGELNSDPIGVNVLANLADVSPSSVSDFFKKQFDSHSKYKNLHCRDQTRLLRALKLLNNEFTVNELYGGTMPGEARDDGRR